jgi:flagellin-like hook-associated protein FlgL
MLRTSTASTYSRLLMGLRFNQRTLLDAQAQAATGRRILHPSDDPAGTARSLSLTQKLSGVARFLGTADTAQGLLDQGGSALQGASSLLGEARALLLQGMSGTLSPTDRDALAGQFDDLRSQMLDLANQKSGERYLFSGTEHASQPWAEVGGRVVYQGNDAELRVQINTNVVIGLNVPGSAIFGKAEYAGTAFSGLTGIAGGTTADEGSGYEHLILRHDATDGSALAGVGIALVNGGAGDTLLGANAIVVDAAAGTIRLGNGPVRNIPEPGSQDAADFVVANEQGGELRLDFTAWDGTGTSGTVTGDGSISLDGSTFTPLSFAETDLELKNPETGSVVHVDTSGVLRAGTELVSFGGANNVFDTLAGIAEDLRNGDGLAHSEMLARLDLRLGELDRNAENVVSGLSTLGSRSARVQTMLNQLSGVDLQLEGLLSDTRDADLAEAVTTMVRAEQTLQIAQATGARLMQTSLLNFLR